MHNTTRLVAELQERVNRAAKDMETIDKQAESCLDEDCSACYESQIFAELEWRQARSEQTRVLELLS
jgi:hypothetical protein